MLGTCHNLAPTKRKHATLNISLPHRMPLPGGVFLDLFERGCETMTELCSDVEEVWRGSSSLLLNHGTVRSTHGRALPV